MTVRQEAVRWAVEMTDRSGLGRLLQYRARRRVAILCYHSVVDGPLPPRAVRAGLHIGLETFTEQMEYLARHFNVLPLADALGALAAPRADDRRTRPAVAITFDDGYANNLHLAGPVLDRLGLPATVFLVTQLLGDLDPFWWDEINLALAAPRPAVGPDSVAGPLDLSSPERLEDTSRRVRECLMKMPVAGRRALMDSLGEVAGYRADQGTRDLLRPLRREEVGEFGGGVTFGNHTATHRILDQIDPTDVVWEVAVGAQELGELVPDRQVPGVLCYPRGASGRLVQELVRGNGVRWGLGLRAGTGAGRTAGTDSHIINLPRQFVAPWHSRSRFRLLLAGLP